MDAGRLSQLWAGKAEPILPTASIVRIVDFWTALGFNTGVWEADEGYAWVYPGADREGMRIDYSLTDGLDPFASSGMAYLTVTDVDAIYAAIIEIGTVPEALNAEGLPRLTTAQLRTVWQSGESLARVARPINQTWGKRELALFDPDNNLIRIGSAL